MYVRGVWCVCEGCGVYVRGVYVRGVVCMCEGCGVYVRGVWCVCER